MVNQMANEIGKQTEDDMETGGRVGLYIYIYTHICRVEGYEGLGLRGLYTVEGFVI